MRLDFNILWVEDQIAAVKAQRDRIEFLLRKEGFKAQVEFANSVEHARVFLSSDVFGDHIDLILMDYELGAGAKGDEGLVEVRNAFSYKDIVFYSARAPDLLKLVADRRIQGVFCSEREDLPNTVLGVFDALVKKVLDIDHSRGIVMGATSDIDHFVNDALLALASEGDGALQSEAMAIVRKRLDEIRKRFEEDLEKVLAATTIPELCELHFIYTSTDRLNLLRKLLKLTGKQEQHSDSLASYVGVAIPKRNLLAHVRVTRDGFSRKLFDRKGIELTSDAMKELRLILLDHHEVFEALAIALSERPAG